MPQRLLIVLVLSLFLPSHALAGFKEGKEAYDQKKWVRAIAELRPLAEAGDDRAMIILGNMYSGGFGVIRSYKEALSLYRRAATEKNNTEAMLAVGSMYASGLGMAPNFNKARRWFERAAQLGDRQGAFFYATILFRGNKSETDDLPPDLYSAYKWYKIAARGAAESSLGKAAEEIAQLLAKDKLKPEEVRKADREALEWAPAEAKTLGPTPEP